MRCVDSYRCGMVTSRRWIVCSDRLKSLLINHLNRGDKIQTCDLTVPN